MTEAQGQRMVSSKRARHSAVLLGYLLCVGVFIPNQAHARVTFAEGDCARMNGAPLEGRATVTMVLSPRMVYSLREWRRMRSGAERAGYRVDTRLDPRVPVSEWRSAALAQGEAELENLPFIDLVDAAALDLLNHAPAASVAWDGRSHPWPILGIMPNQAWLSLLEARLQALRRTECP